MPILLKKIDGSIISLFGDADTDFRGDAILIKSVVGEFGIEDYIKLTAFEAFTQDFERIKDAEYCETVPVLFGPNTCPNYTNLNLSL
tara:strand:+ start:1713 stop:1973 length:261 start_codon:yes stop_codon:yes gene_type:complete